MIHMFLSDTDFLARIDRKEIKLEPFEKQQVQTAGYDLRLHKNFRIFKSGETHIDVREKFEVTKFVDVGWGGDFVIHPGQFVLGSTLEKITLPSDLAGILEGRSSLARIGLVVHATAGLINPGTSSFITFEMSNISNLPIKLYVGMRVAQIVFVQMSSPVGKQYGAGTLKSKYQDQEPPTSSKIWKDFED